jgi:hypothetical protein
MNDPKNPNSSLKNPNFSLKSQSLKNQPVKSPLIKNDPRAKKPDFEKDKTALETKRDIGMLEKLYLWFDYLNFDVMRLPVAEDNAVESLIVSVGPKTTDDGTPDLPPDYLKDHTMIQMFYVNDQVNAMHKAEHPDEPPEQDERYYVLQFYSGLPIKFQLEKFWKVQQVMLLLSDYLPVGNLGIDADKKIYYRYTLFTEKREIGLDMAVDLIFIMDFFLSRFRRKITKFIEGRVKYPEILAELRNSKFVDW